MGLPGFGAEAALYASKHHYAGRGAAFAGANVLPQLYTGPIHFVTCDVAAQWCYQAAQGSGYDPSGWCAYWVANCRPPAPPPGGDSGSGCAAGCWQDDLGNCVCRGGGKVR